MHFVSEKKEAILQVADLQLNPQTREIHRAGKLIPLSSREYKLLQYLMQHKGTIITRDTILSHIWGYSQDIQTRVIDVYIGYLRKKIDEGVNKKLIHSIRGFGYMIKE